MLTRACLHSFTFLILLFARGADAAGRTPPLFDFWERAYADLVHSPRLQSDLGVSFEDQSARIYRELRALRPGRSEAAANHPHEDAKRLARSELPEGASRKFDEWLERDPNLRSTYGRGITKYEGQTSPFAKSASDEAEEKHNFETWRQAQIQLLKAEVRQQHFAAFKNAMDLGVRFYYVLPSGKKNEVFAEDFKTADWREVSNSKSDRQPHFTRLKPGGKLVASTPRTGTEVVQPFDGVVRGIYFSYTAEEWQQTNRHKLVALAASNQKAEVSSTLLYFLERRASPAALQRELERFDSRRSDPNYIVSAPQIRGGEVGDALTSPIRRAFAYYDELAQNHWKSDSKKYADEITRAREKAEHSTFLSGIPGDSLRNVTDLTPKPVFEIFSGFGEELPGPDRYYALPRPPGESVTATLSLPKAKPKNATELSTVRLLRPDANGFVPIPMRRGQKLHRIRVHSAVGDRLVAGTDFELVPGHLGVGALIRLRDDWRTTSIGYDAVLGDLSGRELAAQTLPPRKAQVFSAKALADPVRDLEAAELSALADELQDRAERSRVLSFDDLNKAVSQTSLYTYKEEEPPDASDPRRYAEHRPALNDDQELCLQCQRSARVTVHVANQGLEAVPELGLRARVVTGFVPQWFAGRQVLAEPGHDWSELVDARGRSRWADPTPRNLDPESSEPPPFRGKPEIVRTSHRLELREAHFADWWKNFERAAADVNQRLKGQIHLLKGKFTSRVSTALASRRDPLLKVAAIGVAVTHLIEDDSPDPAREILKFWFADLPDRAVTAPELTRFALAKLDRVRSENEASVQTQERTNSPRAYSKSTFAAAYGLVAAQLRVLNDEMDYADSLLSRGYRPETPSDLCSRFFALGGRKP